MVFLTLAPLFMAPNGAFDTYCQVSFEMQKVPPYTYCRHLIFQLKSCPCIKKKANGNPFAFVTNY
jgi:hypothetical protein